MDLEPVCSGMFGSALVFITAIFLWMKKENGILEQTKHISPGVTPLGFALLALEFITNIVMVSYLLRLSPIDYLSPIIISMALVFLIA